MFTQIINEVAPQKETRIKGRTEKWITSEIIDLMHERDRLLTLSNKNKDDRELRNKYKSLTNEITNITDNAKAQFFSEKIEEHKNDSNLLWKQFKTLGHSHKSKEK